ncbi:hypothetical protein C8P68_11264 [Mucilaginibacter yixingensis]|uniref:Uncharacterized protein n=1 Tax=Mucilaginibacter yixingensis TaxID=1295612 RepID=A0A2T5J4X7_9SPHI|nr:hypothetical protein [Mucilaginibacter yixingensis]PTQ92464.1 hypothetical protein C8P68_11264 [Mucilaginibacter yixingensis]
MKLTFGILIITILCSFLNFQESFLAKITIGKYSYSICKKNAYLHDDRLNAEYFVVYKARTQKRLCSAFLKAIRSDSVFVSGDYKVYRDRIEFIEHYYYNKESNSTDSIKNVFYPNKAGNLILKQSITFKGKQKIKKNY